MNRYILLIDALIVGSYQYLLITNNNILAPFIYYNDSKHQGTWVEYVSIGIFLKINTSVLYRLYNPYGTILFEEIIIYKSFKYLLLPLL